MESDSSDQHEAATASSRASTLDEISESTTMVRPRRRVSYPSGTRPESNYFPVSCIGGSRGTSLEIAKYPGKDSR